jgi:hypothetical protein
MNTFRVWKMLLPCLLACLVPLFLAAASQAAVPGAGLSIRAVTGPTVFSPEPAGIGHKPPPDIYLVTVTNTGSEPTGCTQAYIESKANPVECPEGSTVVSPIVIKQQLPRGLTPTGLVGQLDVDKFLGSFETRPSLVCEESTSTCTYDLPLQPGERLTVALEVAVAPGTVGPVTNSVLVTGGGAPSASASIPTAIGTAPQSRAAPFGLARVTSEVTGVDGAIDAQAGDHPYETSVSFSLNTVPGTQRPEEYQEAGGLHGQPAHVKDVVVDVPPGFVGDPGVVEKCPLIEVHEERCPPDTQIGVAQISIGGREPLPRFEGSEPLPIYNVVPDKGYPAEFAILLQGVNVLIPLYASVTPDSNYGVRITTPGIPEIGAPIDVTTTFFGTPANDPNLANGYRTGVVGGFPLAFLDNPVDCSTAPQVTTAYVDSWERPASYLPDGQPDLSDPRWASGSTTEFPSLVGCELLQFNPSLSVTPDTTRADEPAGTTVDVNVPQAPQQFPALITPEFKDTTVTLPAGLSLDPSAGDGLAGCSDVQINLSSAGLGSCPNGSEIGTVKVTTPLLPEPLEGQVFLGTPHCDPCTNADASDGNMFRIFLQFEGAGVVVKQEGRIFANTSTGQLTTTFKNTPQLPVSQVQLHFNSGSRAGLATPQSCGTFTSTGDITPWSTPITPDATPASQFNVDWDGNGGACPSSLPFAPSFSAGTSNPNAGQFSPFTLTFGREDREQDMSGIRVHMPPGLSGILTGVPLCGEPQADLGTCSSASQIGKMTVAAGPGSHPFYQQGEIYLTGPYHGAPFGLSIVVPTIAGPFNLGNVVVRSQIYVDPLTTALTVTSDPLPQILDGIPLRLRTANVTIDRPGFIFNPTDCAQQHITATVAAAQGAQANVSAPFAVSGCAGLHFGPQVKISTSGRTSRAKGASLDYKIAFPAGPQSNIAVAKVELPKQLPSRLTTLQKACTAAQFEANPAACPVASLIGIAKAITPLLPVPLTGPVYFVSHGGEAFPSLEMVLEGYGVRVDLVGATFISKKGITSTTFKAVPDAPVSSFEIYLPEGKYSALAANGNLCKSKLAMPTDFTAQDGAQFKQSTKLNITGCPKTKTIKNKANKAQKSSHGRGRKS